MDAIDLVIFDMAGTAIEQGDEVASAFKFALQKNEIPAIEEEIRDRMGASKREVISLFVERHYGRNIGSADRTEHAYSDFRRFLSERYVSGGVRPIPGVEATLTSLRKHGIKVALTTGFDREVVDTILRAVGWDENWIDVSLCSDDVPRGRPAPYMIFRAMEATGVVDVGRVIVVGDSVLDLQAGANAGVRGIVGVLSGSHSVDQLGKVKHTHILPSAAELPELIKGEFAR